MSKTIQKIIKFSKGEINNLLDERTDIDILNNSASKIKNYVCSIYGSIKTRLGTKNILKIDFTDKININNIISNIGGEIDNLKNDIIFTSSSGTPSNTNLLLFSFQNTYVNFLNINKIKYIFEEAIINIETEKITETEDLINPDTGDITQNSTTYTIIKKVNIISGGKGYNGPELLIIAKTITEESVFNIIINDIGQILEINILQPGKYSEDVVLESILSLTNSTTLNIKINNNIIQEIVVDENETNYTNIFINDNINSLEIESTKSLNSALQIGNFNLYSFQEQAKNTKVIPFIFNNNTKFLILLSQTEINIVKDDVKVQKIILIKDLQIDNLNKIKFTQNENIIIFTENTQPPKILKRNNDNTWTFAIFNIKNIPYHNFDEESEKVINYTSLTPSVEEGSGYLTSNVNYFNSSMNGQIIDGNGGRFRITEYKDSKKVFGYTIIPFYTKEAFTNFKYIFGFEYVWSKTRGYPNTCLFYQQRLFFGGSKERPLTIWSSRLNQFNDFNNIGNYDSDSINIDILSKDNNEIVNLYGNRGLQIFTGGAEFIASEGNLTPKNFTVIQTSSVGSKEQVEPFDIAGTTVFIDRKGLNLNSFVYNDTQATYNSNAITLLNNHLIKNPTSLAIDYNSNFEDGNFIYIVNSDGTATLANILLEQNINAFTRFETNNGFIIDCITFGDDTYFIIERQGQIFLEKLFQYKTDFTIEKLLLETSIINNLNDYNNLQVRVYSKIRNYGLYKVNNGTIFLNEIITDKVFIGLDIECELISNNISINSQTNNIKSRISQSVITTNNTDTLYFCGQKQISNKLNKNIFNFYACTNWELQNKFNIKSIFDYIEIKSIILYINYGR